MNEEKPAGGGHAWSVSSEAASKYLGARLPYSQYVIDYIFDYHEKASTIPSNWDAVLDLGCGPGQLAIHMSRKFKHIYGRDVSQQMIDIAKTLPSMEQEQLEEVGLFKPCSDCFFDYALGSEDALNMPDNSVDLIIVGSAAHWFDWSSQESSKRIWNEWKRVLRPGGSFIATSAILLPGSGTGEEGKKTRPLRELMLTLPYSNQLGKYYSRIQSDLVAATFMNSMIMPWQLGSSDSQDGWDQSSRLFTMSDLEESMSVGGFPAPKSDPIPNWMSPQVATYITTSKGPGDAHKQTEKRWSTTNPKDAAQWIRSASCYIHYLRDNPDEKILIEKDQDLAARLIKEACDKTGLLYEETIESHSPRGIVALKRGS